MTISNSNLQSILLTSPEASTDAIVGGQLAGKAINALSDNVDGSETEFWSMLSQTLTDISLQGDSQIIENKDLLALFNDFEAELETASDGAVISNKWMHILKSHFAEIELSGSESGSEAGMAQETDMQQTGLIAAISPADRDSQIKDVEIPLPAKRQSVSAPLPLSAGALVKSLSTRTADVGQPSVDHEALNLAEFNQAKAAGLQQGAHKDHEIKLSEMNLDKVFIKPLQSEHQAGALNREFSISPALHSQPLSSIQPLPQSSVQLPSSLQTLSVTPQSGATEWGSALGERVSFLINNKLNSAEIRIDPPHLGKLDIQIQLKEDSAVVMINTQHAQTRDLIDSASYRLREFLQEAGYNSVDVNVSHQEQSTKQESFAGQGQDPSSSDTETTKQSLSESASNGQPLEMLVGYNDGRIDYFA